MVLKAEGGEVSSCIHSRSIDYMHMSAVQREHRVQARQTNRPTDRQTDQQTDRKTDPSLTGPHLRLAAGS